MPETIIAIENLSKKYLIRHQTKPGYQTLREVIVGNAVSMAKTLFKPSGKSSFDPSREEIWALSNINFNIEKGEVIGIIGRNGAGKSTLLKILSRITEPTTGRIRIKGRVASLLEVGTGFHPELTGRENIYLNGAILGMGKVEIKRKFDEIVAFAEVEKFLDTPVKRFSSGMYVRLAFAVAAFLEPEILVIDEVLAVGDIDFQRKCLGRMHRVAGEGRTVLFVSHNMAAITSLCNSAVWLDKGSICQKGDSQSVVQSYLSKGSHYSASLNFEDDPGKSAQITEIKLLDSNWTLSTDFNIKSSLKVRIKYIIRSPLYNYRIGVIVSRSDGVEVFVTNSSDWQEPHRKLVPGEYVSTLHIPGCFLAAAQYLLGVYLGEPGIKRHDDHKDILRFNITGNPFRISENRPGMLVYPFQWDFESV
ncbi:MAG: ABC transporter ATP-binding protein [Desulfobacterales bacterium]